MLSSQEEIKSRIGVVVSLIDIHQDRSQSPEEEMEAKIYQDMMGAAIRRGKKKLGPR